MFGQQSLGLGRYCGAEHRGGLHATTIPLGMYLVHQAGHHPQARIAAYPTFVLVAPHTFTVLLRELLAWPKDGKDHLGEHVVAKTKTGRKDAERAFELI
jgi:hypothetical protein